MAIAARRGTIIPAGGGYHITLLKHPDAGLFGQLAGDWRIGDGHKGAPYVRATAIGQAIKCAMRSLSEIHPALLNLQYALMPDHLHIFLGVEQDLDEHLGTKIAKFKSLANRLARVTVFAPGYKIQNYPFGPRQKPADHDFNLCSQGRMLLVSPQQEIPVTRANCKLMNAIAAGAFTVR